MLIHGSGNTAAVVAKDVPGHGQSLSVSQMSRSKLISLTRESAEIAALDTCRVKSTAYCLVYHTVPRIYLLYCRRFANVKSGLRATCIAHKKDTKQAVNEGLIMDEVSRQANGYKRDEWREHGRALRQAFCQWARAIVHGLQLRLALQRWAAW